MTTEQDVSQQFEHLDPSRFERERQAWAIWVPKQDGSKILKELNRMKLLFSVPHLKPVQPDGDNLRILLSREPPGHLPIERMDAVTVSLTIDNFSLDEILEECLPSDIVRPTGYEAVGHIIHLNLLDEQLPFKYLIGEALLSKRAPICRTVVNKTDSIANEFRVCPLELLAGDEDFEVTVSEHGCSFKFDFSQVYWNSRLATAHKMVVDCVRTMSKYRREQVIIDMTAGVGPFTIPIAKMGHSVYANDKNPASYRMLIENAALNGVGHKVTALNMDAADLIPYLTEQGVFTTEKPPMYHFILNLPSYSIAFLDFLASITVPFVVHVFAFSSEPEPAAAVVQECRAKLMGDVDVISKKELRWVSPTKAYCYACLMVRRVMRSPPLATDEPQRKRARIVEALPDS